jgi:hypothetical protein
MLESQRLVAGQYWLENSRNRRQARREPQPGTPAHGGAGASATRSRGPSGDATVKLAVSASTLALRASSGSDPRTSSGSLFRPPMRPACGDATLERDVSALAQSRSCAHLHGRIPKGAPAPRFGAHTWRGFVTQHGVDSRRVFGHESAEQDTRWMVFVGRLTAPTSACGWRYSSSARIGPVPRPAG